MHVTKEWERTDSFGAGRSLLIGNRSAVFIQEGLRWVFHVKDDYISLPKTKVFEANPRSSVSRDAAPG